MKKCFLKFGFSNFFIKCVPVFSAYEIYVVLLLCLRDCRAHSHQTGQLWPPPHV